MSIVKITGPAKSGKTLLANALRNNQVSQKRGALLIDEQTEGELVHMVEKIIAGAVLVPGTPADKIPWKPESAVILVGDRASMLSSILYDIEKMVPGFTATHGPVYTVQTGVEP